MFSNRIAKEWQYKWFGFWGLEEKYNGEIYKSEDYIDLGCPSEVRKKIVTYLKNSPNILVGQVPRQKCGLCNELLEAASFFPMVFGCGQMNSVTTLKSIIFASRILWQKTF